MNTKKCYIGISKIPLGGLGLFAGEKILKGEVVWENHPASELKYTQEQFDALPEPFKYGIRKYIYKCGGLYHLNLDDSRHYNHSDTPNTTEDENSNYIAVEDIQKDEELTCDYAEFKDDKNWKPNFNEMEIVELNLENIDYVVGIMMDRWEVSKEYATAEVERWLRNEDNSVCFVGVVDGVPMATGALDLFPKEFGVIDEIDYSIPCWNTLLWVEPEYRGKEYGRMLSKVRFEYAKKLGYKTIYLDTIKAKDYHLKFDWEIIKELDKDGEHYFIMKYNL